MMNLISQHKFSCPSSSLLEPDILIIALFWIELILQNYIVSSDWRRVFKLNTNISVVLNGLRNLDITTEAIFRIEDSNIYHLSNFKVHTGFVLIGEVLLSHFNTFLIILSLYAKPLCCTWKSQHHFPMEFPVPSREWIFNLFHHLICQVFPTFVDLDFNVFVISGRVISSVSNELVIFRETNIPLTLALSKSSEFKASNMLYPRVITTLYRFIYFIFLYNRFAIKKNRPIINKGG